MNSIRYWVGEKVSRTRVLGVGTSVAYPVSILSQISPLLLSKVNTRGLIYHSVRGSRVIFPPELSFSAGGKFIVPCYLGNEKVARQILFPNSLPSKQPILHFSNSPGRI